jgi:glycosyltransferase involved in cell wall biosynthesis
MKVLVVNRHHDDAVGGSEIQCDLIARELLDRGHRVVYVAVDGNGPYDRHPYRIVPVAMRGHDIADACLAERPDVVYWRLNKHFLRRVAKTLDAHHVPLVVAVSHWHDLLPWRIKSSAHEPALGRLKRLLLERWNFGGYRWVSGVVCQTPEQLAATPKPRAIVIPNSAQMRRSIPFSWPRPYVAWVANLKASKRPELCVELARHLLPHGVDLVMVGRLVDPAYSWLEGYAIAPENLHYIGPRSVEEVSGVLAGALALVHTCMPEGFPNIFIQSWQQATPTVSIEYDPGGIIKTHALGYVSEADERRFHQDVLRLVKDPTLAREAGKRGQRYVMEHCDAKYNVAKLETFLRKVVGTSSMQTSQ